MAGPSWPPTDRFDGVFGLRAFNDFFFDPLPPGRLSGALPPIPLGELSRGEAVRLMGTLPALRETDYDARLRVFQAVGGHPFVLNLFAERATRDGDGLLHACPGHFPGAQLTLRPVGYA